MVSAEESLRVEVVYAEPHRQKVCAVELVAPATVADALAAATLASDFPEVNFGAAKAAVWGRPVARSSELVDGDRVEILRPLKRDPRDARRDLAEKGSYMGPAGAE